MISYFLTRRKVELIATWHKYDKKHGGRLLQIRKSLLTLLAAMNASKECRHKLADVENMRKLYVVCDDMLTSRAPEQLIKQILSIMNRALPLGLDFRHYDVIIAYPT